MKKSKKILMLLTCGSMLLGGGCPYLSQLFQYGVYYAGLEFISDNDGVFDLFEGGATATNP